MGLGDILDRLRVEWAVIRQAPFSFGIALFVAAAAVWGGVSFVYSTRLENERSINALLHAQLDKRNADQPEESPSGAPSTEQMSSLGSGAIVIKGVPVERLRADMTGKTSAEFQRLVEPYIGTAITITGPVSDVRPNAIYDVELRARTSAEIALLKFAPRDEKRVIRLSVGETITATCEFRQIVAAGVSLRNCALVAQP